jgi:hypothetical protein
MAKFPLFNRDGKYAGEAEVPDEILDAATRVHRWMQSNNVTLLRGLSLKSVVPSEMNITAAGSR